MVIISRWLLWRSILATARPRRHCKLYLPCGPPTSMKFSLLPPMGRCRDATSWTVLSHQLPDLTNETPHLAAPSPRTGFKSSKSINRINLLQPMEAPEPCVPATGWSRCALAPRIAKLVAMPLSSTFTKTVQIRNMWIQRYTIIRCLWPSHRHPKQHICRQVSASPTTKTSSVACSHRMSSRRSVQQLMALAS